MNESEDTDTAAEVDALVDKLDEQQIVEEYKDAQRAFANEISKMEIGSADIVQVAQRIANAGRSRLQLMEGRFNLHRFDDRNEDEWCWDATVKVRDKETGHETRGMSEMLPYLLDGEYDSLGHVKAVLKAVSDAYGKHFSGFQIRGM